MGRNEDSVDGGRFFHRGFCDADRLPLAQSALYIYPMFINQLSSVSTTTWWPLTSVFTKRVT